MLKVLRVTRDRDAAVGKLLGRPGLSFVATVDAATMGSEYEIFEAMNASFRLPAYFGWNWDALYDCLSNLEWVEADRYVLLIENPDQLDIQGSQAHADFVAVLGRALRAWDPSTFAPGRRSAEFLVMLDSGSESLARVQQAFGTLGIGIDEI